MGLLVVAALAMVVGARAVLGGDLSLASRPTSGPVRQPYYVPEPPVYYVVASDEERGAAQCVVDQIERIRLDSGEKEPFRAFILSESVPSESDLVQQITTARRSGVYGAPRLVDLRGVKACYAQVR